MSSKAEDAGRLDVEPTSRSVRRDLLKRHIGQREAGRAEHEAGEEGQIERLDLDDRVAIFRFRPPGFSG